MSFEALKSKLLLTILLLSHSRHKTFVTRFRISFSFKISRKLKLTSSELCWYKHATSSDATAIWDPPGGITQPMMMISNVVLLQRVFLMIQYFPALILNKTVWLQQHFFIVGGVEIIDWFLLIKGFASCVLRCVEIPLKLVTKICTAGC